MTDENRDKILIVDDNTVNLKYIGTVLKENGYSVIVAQDGDQALKSLSQEKPDLVLLDIMMPGMDGFEVCEKIKHDRETKDIPVIFLTARTKTRDVIKGFKAGGADYVCKPFESEELLARIETHIDLKKAREEILTLQGLIPICSYCKKVRDDESIWHQIESYIEERSGAAFSHGVCPDCAEDLYGGEEWYKRMKQKSKI